MMPETDTCHPEVKSVQKTIRVDRLIALWALSEAALGGVLHAFRIPFTGLIVNSAAVLLMVMIATAAERKGAVLQATVIVLIIKGIISPHTPLAAYVAVSFQGLMGELLLRSKKYLFLSSLALGIITLFQSAIQKIVILTLVYGRALWESIDIFINFVISQFSFIPQISDQINFSNWLIALYIGIHLLAGAGIGLIAARLPKWLDQELKITGDLRIKFIPPGAELLTLKKRKRGLKKPSVAAIIFLAASLFIASYLYPEISRTQGMEALIMIIRAAFILLIWYSLLGPQLLRLYQHWAKDKKTRYAQQVQEAIDIFPAMRAIIRQTWQKSAEFRGIRRIRKFMVCALAIILTVEF